jgi:hypothetical protein
MMVHRKTDSQIRWGNQNIIDLTWKRTPPRLPKEVAFAAAFEIVRMFRSGHEFLSVGASLADILMVENTVKIARGAGAASSLVPSAPVLPPEGLPRPPRPQVTSKRSSNVMGGTLSANTAHILYGLVGYQAGNKHVSELKLHGIENFLLI